MRFLGIDWVELAKVALPLAVAIATGYFTVLAGRKKASADIQEKLNTGFSGLVEMLRGEITSQKSEIQRLETEVGRLRRQLLRLRLYLARNKIELPSELGDVEAETM